jgi:uncharacterized protein (TIGR03435 family)
MTLTYRPENGISRGGEPDSGDISVFTAVREQLGLRLKPQKALFEMLVVDHLDKPSAN